MDPTIDSFERNRARLLAARELYFIGICGVSMSGLAVMAASRGLRVRGCDRDSTSAVAHLLFRHGISVESEANAHPEGAQLSIVTSAVPETAPAVLRAREAHIPLISRAAFLALLMADAPTRVTVSGMHGKSTTVGMLSAILVAAGSDPTVSCGAPLTPRGPTFRLGGGEIFLAEACEYRDAFLSLSPTLAVVTNIDHDHPDYFPDLGAVKSSFLAFMAKAPRVIVGADCAPLSDIAPTDAMTFGYRDGARLRATDGEDDACHLLLDREPLGELRLSVAGHYNRLNALAATAAALSLGIPFSTIRAALEGFRGIGRRMEAVGTLAGAQVVLDYAHHPTELRAALEAARGLTHGRLLCVFQPHTYTRTAALWQDFTEVLALSDETLLVDIYPAREPPLPAITSERLARESGAAYAPDLPAAARWAQEKVRAGDLLCLMGAGDIDALLHLLPLAPTSTTP